MLFCDFFVYFVVYLIFFFFFFFQAEDGIRDWSVTGVQTCALPISGQDAAIPERGHRVGSRPSPEGGHDDVGLHRRDPRAAAAAQGLPEAPRVRVVLGEAREDRKSVV